MLAAALQRIETRDRQFRRIEQLSAVLNAAAEWLRLDDDHVLLTRIADTSTQLLDCERASIFLWDREQGEVVAVPALGVDGETLRIPDDRGEIHSRSSRAQLAARVTSCSLLQASISTLRGSTR